MELIRLSERVWYSMYEEERDRPCLGYIKGDRWSLAVDAGHSSLHLQDLFLKSSFARVMMRRKGT